MGISAMIKSQYSGLAGGYLGTYVERATSVPGANVWLSIFTVSVGNVLMTMLIGETTIAEATGATNMDIQINPTAGAAVSFSAATAVTGDAIGTIYTFTGNPADACYAGLAVQAGMSGGLVATGQQMKGWIVPPGTVQWRETIAAPTHSVQWYLFFIPIDRGAAVVAA